MCEMPFNVPEFDPLISYNVFVLKIYLNILLSVLLVS